ncbi:C1 family peptidase [Tuwongella immobilis]|uniref:Peptidase C1A papain C-terminal domain-containing protein n=1 Tax=Tuwongella immobilis TaxID=692036 RepID=A0A6C2YW44_9BACT|nr:C1 family peptidase [Tuwongella immobilis]VIP05597.1 cysteine protease : Uncharacterized protein OS=Isosphaera pallida (strain ATCC 43644 / DSM 9630 / IS1B) GN=Isop_1985 PE=4 SV=1: Peptidase_C1 [Tuwongella immobilis]VTS08549.1 cysteine protease : Uncharacterized protein OS=Isosphaera pallida (strain ATCC 43644 / DSM 9630 / IS1B) GN=Isop_1985 PE=4 SV=1: Peptidase_C1 [Tuwongella immobilis]
MAKWFKILAAILGALATVTAAFVLTVAPVDPEPVAVPGAFGWVADPDAVAEVAKVQPSPTIAQTPAGGVPVESLPDHAYLWELERNVTGQNPPPQNQKSVGSCVSFGTARAIERTLAGQRQGAPPVRLVEEVIYGGSRVEIGGGRISGDGSIGAWAAEFVKQYGVLERGAYPGYDLRSYSESLCRDFGRLGVPDPLEPTVRKFPVKSITQVTTWTEAKQALASRYGIAISSSQGFQMQRDSRGICGPFGRWMHCMCLDGYHRDADGTEYGHIENSWGADAHRGPVGWGNPSTAGFWARADVIDKMLRQGDSWAFSDVQGFPARLDWLLQNNPKERAYAAVSKATEPHHHSNR